MRVTKWKTNGEFFEQIQLGGKKEEEGDSKVPGLHWNLNTDTFSFNISKTDKRNEEIWNKIRILSKIGRP